jgi:predicted transcriptional regulator
LADVIQLGSRRNFFIVDNGIFDERLNLDPLDKLVYICLLRYANNSSREAYPGQETIAKNVGISRKRVNIAVKVLEEKGLIKKEQRFDKKGGQKSNNYIVYDANEVIHRVYPENTGGVSQSHRGCNPGLQKGVSQSHTNNTYLKILKEEESLGTDQKHPDSETFFKNIAEMKKVLLADNKEESEE